MLVPREVGSIVEAAAAISLLSPLGLGGLGAGLVICSLSTSKHWSGGVRPDIVRLDDFNA